MMMLRKTAAGAIAVLLSLLVFISFLPLASSQSLPAPNTLPQIILPESNPQDITTSIHLLLGNPSQASYLLENADNYLMLKPQYALSYNRSKGIPNWVSWQVNENWLGDAPRQDDFRPDRELPKGLYRVTPRDYAATGFDRGHVIPSEDRGASIADNSSTFLMTNILPQSPDNNRGPWVKLESYCRYLVRQGKTLYIIAGGAGTGGMGEKGAMTSLANGKVAVPSSTWKIIVILDKNSASLGNINQSTRVIAVIVPNEQGIKAQDWRIYRKSVDEIESLTGYDFLTNVPKEIQEVIEAKIDILP